MNWNWVPKDTVHGIHATSLAVYGGGDGVRDEGLLESALGRPENLAVYGAPSAFDLAAAYAFGIAKNHPLVDGNKRTAFVTTALFLELNGYSLVADEPAATATMLAFATGEVDESEYANWLKDNSKKK
jgi:death on curing protein